MARYVLEGEWTGYTSAQRRVVHCEIIRSEARADRLRKLHAIRYTDGTSLILDLRPLEPRERPTEIHGYSSLIREAEAKGTAIVAVADLAKVRA